MKKEKIKVKNVHSTYLNIQKKNPKEGSIYFAEGEVKEVLLDDEEIQNHINVGLLEIVEGSKKAEPKKEEAKKEEEKPEEPKVEEKKEEVLDATIQPATAKKAPKRGSRRSKK